MDKQGGNSKSASLESVQLFEAVCAGDVALAQQLIEANANVDYYQPASANYSGESCLVAAIDTDNIEMVELLLNHGADPNLQDENSNTPLALAIAAGNVKAVETLINYGVDINFQSGTNKNTPLIEAIREDQDTIFHLLLSRGANPRVKNYNGENTFAFAKRNWWQLPPELLEEQEENLFKATGHAIKKRFGRK